MLLVSSQARWSGRLYALADGDSCIWRASPSVNTDDTLLMKSALPCPPGPRAPHEFLHDADAK
jgi:hypothetical protein